MPVYEVTLKGWRPNDPTEASEECIKWVEASDMIRVRQWLAPFLDEGVLLSLTETDLGDSLSFTEGCDVVLSEKGSEYAPSCPHVSSWNFVSSQAIQSAIGRQPDPADLPRWIQLRLLLNGEVRYNLCCEVPGTADEIGSRAITPQEAFKLLIDGRVLVTHLSDPSDESKLYKGVCVFQPHVPG